jgi:sugar lactone lactonase YvrE
MRRQAQLTGAIDEAVFLRTRESSRRAEEMRARRTISTSSLGLVALGLFWCAVAAHAQEYKTSVVVMGLNRPTGIAIQGSETIFFTELPTPGIPGTMGGRNTVNRVNLESGTIRVLTRGEPEPTNLALAKDGTLYWTCKSANVILKRTKNGTVSLFLGHLDKPNGISVDRWDNVFFTELPTPGVAGSMNTVSMSDGTTTTVLTMGEPEPTDIVVARDGTAYWTCKTANVILKRSPDGVVSLVLKNLNRPVGIALDHKDKKLYWTEVPTPGVSGSKGGSNSVKELNLETLEISEVDFGDPQPTDITVARNGNLYWTCTSAGVIVEARPNRKTDDDN